MRTFSVYENAEPGAREWVGTHRLPVDAAISMAKDGDRRGLFVVVIPDDYKGTPTEFINLMTGIYDHHMREADQPEPFMGYTPGEDRLPERGAIPGEMFRA